MGLLGAGLVDHRTLDTLAIVAAARTAMTRAAAAAAILVLGLGFALGAFFVLDQRLPVGDGDLVVIGMNFAERQEAVAVAAIFDEGSLQRRFDSRDFGEIDVSA